MDCVTAFKLRSLWTGLGDRPQSLSFGGRDFVRAEQKQAGVDATAARSCFLMLKVLLQNGGVDLVLSGASPEILELLRSHGVVTDNDRVFSR